MARKIISLIQVTYVSKNNVYFYQHNNNSNYGHYVLLNCMVTLKQGVRDLLFSNPHTHSIVYN
jgi:hypothetical protein